MKYLVLAATATAVAASSPHHHKHAHLHDRAVYTHTDVVATATVFQANGTPISKDEACKGVAQGQYEWGFPGLAELCGAATSTSETATETPTPTPTPETTPPPSSSSSEETSSTSTSWTTSSTWEWTSTAESTSSSAAATSSSSSGSSWTSWGSGVDKEFPDGELDCDTFPSDYGPIALHYLGLGGWSGIQSPTYGVEAIIDIVTGISGSSCKEGDLCSYACPPGYQKSQWPSTQGATGQSVGGIQCSGGKLKLTNSALSKKLCIEGVGGVSATNKAGKVVAICRTDYPGTESETIPVELQSGDTQPLAVPDASSYYFWQGKSTSAQYYLNPPGYSAEEACQWGSAGTPIGNFAPTNFGVGYSAGKTWLSIFPNAPTTDVEYPGTIEIQGDNLSGSCKYSNGVFESDTGTSSTGCTVAVVSGSATFVIS
ncbi:hypothetical protein DV738_g3030, partial [Chaetothyriales sp. CBS 135597]